MNTERSDIRGGDHLKRTTEIVRTCGIPVEQNKSSDRTYDINARRWSRFKLLVTCLRAGLCVVVT